MKPHQSHRSNVLAAIVCALPVAQTPSSSPSGGDPVHVSASAARVWGDADGDSLLDLYVVNSAGEDRLFRNRGDGSFEDVTVRAGLAGRTGTLSANWHDFDSDRKLDLLLVTVRGEVLVFRGESAGIFRESAVELGIEQTGFVKSAEWRDYDKDGCSDLSVVAEGHGPLFFHGVKGRAFERVELVLPTASLPAAVSGGPQPTPPADVDAPLRNTAGEPSAVMSAETSRRVARGRTSGGDAPAATTLGSGAVAPDPGSHDPAFLPPHGNPDPPPTCVTDQSSSSCITVSTVPQFGSLYPLGNEFSIDPSGRVTIGIDGGSALELGPAPVERRLYVRTDVSSALAIFGESTSTVGATEGIRGQSASAAGRGVIGRASALTGSTEGVRGESASLTGRGVSGEAPAEGIRGSATATAGIARGILGTSMSSEGEGVLGEVTATSGINVGVRGTSASPTGRGVGGRAPSEGVRGEATATAGIARGILGTSISTEGEGVLGEVTAASGDNVGVRGTSASPTGRGVGGRAPSEGVRGEATATAGIARGILGTSMSSEGEGVLGEVTAASGDNVGVRGTSASSAGRGIEGSAPSEGVRGTATAPAGDTVGVRGASSAGTGVEGGGPKVGVRGIALSPTGIGVLGFSVSSEPPPIVTFGVGVRGHTADYPPTIGPMYGVYGSSDAADLESAGVFAAGNGAISPGQPRAAALEISNGAIVVSGTARPAGSFKPFEGPGPGWTPIQSCSTGGPPHTHAVGHYSDRSLDNDLIVVGSFILLTVDAGTDSGNPSSYSAQVVEVLPGTAVIRISATGCTPPPPVSAAFTINYLIINP